MTGCPDGFEFKKPTFKGNPESGRGDPSVGQPGAYPDWHSILVKITESNNKLTFHWNILNEVFPYVMNKPYPATLLLFKNHDLQKEWQNEAILALESMYVDGTGVVNPGQLDFRYQMTVADVKSLHDSGKLDGNLQSRYEAVTHPPLNVTNSLLKKLIERLKEQQKEEERFVKDQ